MPDGKEPHLPFSCMRDVYHVFLDEYQDHLMPIIQHAFTFLESGDRIHVTLKF